MKRMPRKGEKKMVTGSHLLERLSTSVWYVRPEFLQTMQNILELKFVDNLKVDQIKELFTCR